MVFDQIEQLKQEFTDKYVIVDENRPELRRFKGMTGTVRTVNMNGRALVEFDANLNIGWYDIDLDFLQVVDKPLEKPEKPKAAAKPAAKKPAKAAAKAKGPASAADILAAARGGGAPKKEKPAAMSPADILAAARGGAAKPAESKKSETKPAKADPSKMSAADILAAARGGGAAPAAKPEPAAQPDPEPVAEEAPAPAVPEPAAEKPPVGDLPTNVDDILAFCRERDGS